MSSLVSQLSQEVHKLIVASVCAKCGDSEEMRRLYNCGHLLCLLCFNSAASKCPVCEKPIQRKDSLKDHQLDDVLKTIHILSNIDKSPNNAMFNFEYPKFETFFAPESAINKQDHKGETRLHKDCREGHVTKVETLLQTGIDVNIQDFAGWTALHESVTAQKTEVVKLLLDYGAFVNIPGLSYTTPLHRAVQDGNIPIAKLLVEYGAELMCYDREGKTPIDICNSTEMQAVLCLTPRRPFIYKIYTVPQAKVFFSNIKPEDMLKLSEVPGVIVTTDRSLLNIGDVFYLIVGNQKPNVKYLQAAMLQGSCIVNANWINDFIDKKYTLNPMNYLIEVPGYALKKALMNNFNKLPKLFDGLRFFFRHTNVQTIGGYKYTADDLKKLIKLGGGKVVTRRPTRIQDNDVYYPYHVAKGTSIATTTYYLIYDETQVLQVQSDITGLKHKSAKWLIECINNFTLIA